MDESCARYDNQGPRAQPYFAAPNATAMVNVGREPEDIPEQAVVSAAKVVTDPAPTTSLALTTTLMTPRRQATGDMRVALSDGTFGLLIAAQNGDTDRLNDVFKEYRREPTAAPAATPASKPVSYVTTKTEKLTTNIYC